MPNQGDSLTNAVSGLWTGYQEKGLVNQGNLPSKREISDLLWLIYDTLFPGFSSGQVSLVSKDILHNRLQDIQVALLESITKVLNWEQLTPELAYTSKHIQWNSFSDPATPVLNDSPNQRALEVTSRFLESLPVLRQQLTTDIEATFLGDPAAKSIQEIVMCYPGFYATALYRLAHYFYQEGIPLIPRMMTEWGHTQTGIDIHPGATIGHSFCIDHGSGVVIGETALIGHHVKLYHGVTLGALSVKKSKATRKRHPTLGNYTVVYAHTTILGGDTEIGDHCIIGGNVWLTHSIPSHSTIYLSEDDTSGVYRQLMKPTKNRDNTTNHS